MQPAGGRLLAPVQTLVPTIIFCKAENANRVLLPAPKIGDPRQRVADLLFHFNLRQNRISDFWKIVEILKNEAVRKKDCDNNRGHRCILYYYVASIKYHSFVDDCYILIQHYGRKCKIMQELFGILRKSWGIFPDK